MNRPKVPTMWKIDLTLIVRAQSQILVVSARRKFIDNLNSKSNDMRAAACTLLLFCIVCALLYGNGVLGKPKKPESSKSPSSKATKPIKLNVDVLPPLQEVLEEMQITPFLKDFVRMGITETRLLLRLSSMDFQLMTMEWTNFSYEHVSKLKSKIVDLTKMATVTEDKNRPEIEMRNKLTYGKVILPHGVQAFEYSLASFGTSPPIGPVHLRLSADGLECDKEHSADYTGHFVVARRGNCTFLSKAQTAFQHGAQGLIIINSEDKLDSPASGLGIDGNITEAMVKALDSFVVLGMSNTTWEALSRAVQYAENHLPAHIVPIKCQTGGRCLPLLDEEKKLQTEVSWGRMRVRMPASGQAKSFDFLTSIIGAPLPVGQDLPLFLADPIDACAALPNVTSSGSVALLAHRGQCRFDTKVLGAQQAGARVLVVVDIEDQALQRIGAVAPEVGYLGIPSILISAEAGDFIRSAPSEQVWIDLVPSADTSGFDSWIEVAYMDWAEHPQERLMQIEGLVKKYQDKNSQDLVSWLQRRADAISFIRETAVEAEDEDL
ncbi:hypothetical protein EON65_02185 [archaeon]|nr:MAG: hypothetical protein EON65_02185 [archaeon]